MLLEADFGLAFVKVPRGSDQLERPKLKMAGHSIIYTRFRKSSAPMAAEPRLMRRLAPVPSIT
jgi:hypothetical protein